MARILSVYREGALYLQQELTSAGLRLGRAEDSDVVLEDALKRVSRNHAELRVEHDQVVLVDLGSSNGTFVNDERITSTPLPPQVPFTLGPYHLTWEEVASWNGTSDPTDVPASATESAPSERVPRAAGQRRSEPPTPVAGGSALAGRVLWLGLGAVTVAGAVGLWSLLAGPGQERTGPGDQVGPVMSAEEHLATARRLLQSAEAGAAATALREHLTPLLAADPANDEALRLKARAEAALLGQAEPPGSGHGEPPQVLLGTPPVTAPVSSGAPPAAGTPLGMRWPYPFPQLPRLARESDEALIARSKGVSSRYEQARDVLAREELAAALPLLEGLAAEYGWYRGGPGLPVVSDLLIEARALRKNEAERALRIAEAHEEAGDFPRASGQYRRAKTLDETLDVQAALDRVRIAAHQVGLDAYNKARVYQNYRKTKEALEEYERALQFLDPASAEYADAETQHRRLKSGS